MYSFDPPSLTLVAFRVDGRWWASLSETWPPPPQKKKKKKKKKKTPKTLSYFIDSKHAHKVCKLYRIVDINISAAIF